MGWTGYVNGETAGEAIAAELAGCDVLRSSGAWRLYRNPAGFVCLTHFLTERRDGEVWVKGIDASMGPGGVPPRSILTDYLARTSERERNECERDWLDKCAEVLDRRDAAKGLRPGDLVRFRGPLLFADGVECDTFIWSGKYRAQRSVDGVTVRLPKSWRSQVAVGA